MRGAAGDLIGAARRVDRLVRLKSWREKAVSLGVRSLSPVGLAVACAVLFARPDGVGFAQVAAPEIEQPAAGATVGNGALTGFQGALLADPASRDGVFSLQDDPLVADILRDEETMRAIESGDLGRLLADPKLRALAEHPTVREIIERQER